MPSILEALGWSARDAVAFVVAISAAILILVNTLFLQPGPHPAPMVKSSVAAIMPPSPVQSPALASATSAPVPSRATARGARAEGRASQGTTAALTPAALTPAAPATPPRTAVVADIQRELSRRGFYDGAVDGLYGPRTDAAIRDFEQAAGLRPSTEPNEALLRSIRDSPVRSKTGAASAGADSAGASPIRSAT